MVINWPYRGEPVTEYPPERSEEEISKILNEFEAQGAAHQGELVLVVERRQYAHESGGCFPVSFHNTSEHWQLGVLNGQLQRNNTERGMNFPTKKYVTEGGFSRDISIFDGPIRADFFGLFVNQSLPYIEYSLHSEKQLPWTEVAIGDMGVIRWFENQGSGGLITLWLGAKALGKQLPAHPAILASLEKGREILIAHLEEFAHERRHIEQKIANVYARISKTYTVDGAVIEDEDDAKVYTIRDRRRLREVKAEMAQRLARAQELEMDRAECLRRITARMTAEMEKFLTLD